MFDNLFTEGLGLMIGMILSGLGVSVYIGKIMSDIISKHRMRRGVFNTSDVYDLLQKTKHNLKAKKDLILCAHNGGSFVNK